MMRPHAECGDIETTMLIVLISTFNGMMISSELFVQLARAISRMKYARTRASGMQRPSPVVDNYAAKRLRFFFSRDADDFPHHFYFGIAAAEIEIMRAAAQTRRAPPRAYSN